MRTPPSIPVDPDAPAAGAAVAMPLALAGRQMALLAGSWTCWLRTTQALAGLQQEAAGRSFQRAFAALEAAWGARDLRQLAQRQQEVLAGMARDGEDAARRMRDVLEHGQGTLACCWSSALDSAPVLEALAAVDHATELPAADIGRPAVGPRRH